MPGVIVPNECLAKIERILGHKYKERGISNTRVRFARDFLISGMLKILFTVTINELTYTELYKKSKIINRNTFSTYLEWMSDMGWVNVDQEGVFRITEKGQFLLRAFS